MTYNQITFQTIYNFREAALCAGDADGYNKWDAEMRKACAFRNAMDRSDAEFLSVRVRG